jgi:hypothetical protein
MTKDQFCTYVQGILDMELEIAKIAHKTKEDIELVGALKLIQDALKKVENNETPFYPIMPPTYPDTISPPWTITCGTTSSTIGTDGTQVYTTYNKSKKKIK